ncbi:MAG: aminopeptidase [Ahrensia sp.]
MALFFPKNAGLVETLLKRQPLIGAFAMACLLFLQGCIGVGYYAKSLGGHIGVLNARESVEELRRNADTPAPLRAQMDRAADIRQFAIDELGLPDNASYRTYVDLDRDYVTMAVFAAPEFSGSPKTWCFPVFGCVPYRAYFDEADARTLADELSEQGYDVHLSGVPAYSTLGWTPDPLLSTMFQFGEIYTASVVFHELAHQEVYIRNDTSFNEAFAVAVEIEGTKAWLRARAGPDAVARYENSLQRRNDFGELVGNARASLNKIFVSNLPDEEKRAAKAAAIEQLRADYRVMRNTRWNGFSGYDNWFDEPINNAKLALVGVYGDLVGDFRHLFVVCGSDFERLYGAVAALGKQPKNKRRAALKGQPELFCPALHSP